MRIDARLQQLFGLQKKYHATSASELLGIMGSVQSKMDALGSLEQEIEAAKKESAQAAGRLQDAGKKLSDSRMKAIPGIQKRINELLAKVEMPDAKISVQHTGGNSPGSDGTDEVNFLFAANKGSVMQALNKVASGGELSRLMLCIKSLVSDKVHLPTIIFDEIDTGISGEAALKVSQVMKSHATRHQVIAITHLPQIAGNADAHFFVYKSSDKKTTSTNIRKLTEHERVEEIARMLHGENPSEKILDAARELIN
jgi:DNA repair protein RecN (Recombination protein N)